VLFFVAIRAQDDALIEFRFDSIKWLSRESSNLDILLARIKVMELKSAMVPCVATPATFSTFVRQASFFCGEIQFMLPVRNTNLAVFMVTVSILPEIECLLVLGLLTRFTRKHTLTKGAVG
jgi:hypothetical protein